MSTAKSNLFELDIASIIERLKEANERLFVRSEAVIDAAFSLLDDEKTPEDKLVAVATRLKKNKRELAAARLSDAKVFKEAVNEIEKLFKGLESKSKAGLARVETRLAALIKPVHPTSAYQPIAISRDGEVVGEMRIEAPAPVSVGFEIKWEVSAVNRDMVDLEALRHVFTDHELMTACRRHLTNNGPSSLRGVTYRQIPKL